MMRLLTGILTFSLLAATNLASGCTAFKLQHGSAVYVAKNLDWNIGYGYLFLNEKDVSRSTLITELFGTHEFCWRSKYRSLTFNQFGKGFPLGGMNECGLVVEELNAMYVSLDPIDSLNRINEFQFIQYLLDMCRSSREVEAQLSKFQYKPLLLHLHYLVSDEAGNVIIVEFNGDRFDIFHANETGVPVLSNNNYRESLKYLSKFKGFGGEMEVLNRPGSNERFITVANGLKQYGNEDPVGYSFQLLDMVRQADTQWSLVYDLNRLSIHFKNRVCDSIITFDFRKMLSSQPFYSSGNVLGRCDPGIDVITADMNTHLLQDVFHSLSSEAGSHVDYNLMYSMAMAGNHYLKDSPDDTLMMELNEVITPLPGTAPLTYPDSIFHEMAQWDDFEVVAMGEATHGTREFCELKHRIFRILVEKYGFRVLAYEYSFRKSVKINDYIMEGTGNIDSILQNESWIQNNIEVKELITWMREYNKDKPLERKVQFIGIDNQVDAYSPAFVIQFLQLKFPGFLSENRSLTSQILNLTRIRYQDMTEEEFAARKSLFEQLNNQVKVYFQTSSGSELERNRFIVLNLIRAVIRSHDFLFRLARGENIRDAQLAENVLFLKNSLEENKLVVWAHNAHVANNPDYYGWQQPAMGWYLKKRLNKKYCSVATSFSKGKFRAVMLDENGNDTEPLTCEIKTAPPSVSINRIFESANKDFFLKTKSIGHPSSLYQFMNQKRPMIGVGDLYLGVPEKHFTNDRIINLITAYDLVFYFTDTHAVTL